LELEDHPAIKTEKIIKDPTQKNINRDMHPEEKEITVKEKAQTNTDNTRASMGDKL